MTTCPNCGKVAGLHSSILQGCMCQYSMQAPPQCTWQGLTTDEIAVLHANYPNPQGFALALQAKLKEKNGA